MQAEKKRRLLHLIEALAINAFFLAAMLIFFAPIYETNDDTLMVKFIDGQFSSKSVYVPFINICLAWFLKTLYVLFGDGFNWYSLCQYAMILLSFTAVTWVLLERFRPLPALMITAVVLCTMGMDCYLSMNFSKPAGAATVGGMTLMLHAMSLRGKERRLPLILGFITAAIGYMWRFEEFAACAVLMSGACLVPAAELLFSKNGKLFSRIKKILRRVLPVILLAAVSVGLYFFNAFAWARPEIRDYTEFDRSRWLLMDYKIPEYSEMRELYDKVGMDESFVKMMNRWCFYDTEVFTVGNIDTLINERDDYIIKPTAGECLGTFLNECVRGFFLEKPVWCFAALFMLWLACGGRKPGNWLSLFYILGGFFVLYMYFIYTNRFLVNRIDGGIFFAMAMVLLFSLRAEKVNDEKLLCVFVMVLSLFVGYRYSRRLCPSDDNNRIEDHSREKAAIELIMRDDRHFYFEKYTVQTQMYSPLERMPHGYAEKIMPIGGWSMNHPMNVRLLESLGIENPYRDLVNREDIYLIDYDIETTLNYLRGRYYPDAEAELIEPMSTETGFKIYKITG